MIPLSRTVETEFERLNFSWVLVLHGTLTTDIVRRAMVEYLEVVEYLEDRHRRSVRPETDAANFTGLVLGCIETKFCKKICV